MRRSTAPTRRRRRLLATSLPVALAVALVPAVPAAVAAPPAPITTTVTAGLVESGTWVVPQGVTSVKVTAQGGDGGRGGQSYGGQATRPAGGKAIETTVAVPVTPGDVLTFTVGTRGGHGADAAWTLDAPTPGQGGTGMSRGGTGGYGTSTVPAGTLGVVESAGGGGGGSTGVAVGADTVLEVGGGGGGGGNVLNSTLSIVGGAGGQGTAFLNDATARAFSVTGSCDTSALGGPGWGDGTHADSTQTLPRLTHPYLTSAGSGGGGGGAPTGHAGVMVLPLGAADCMAAGPGGNGGRSVTTLTTSTQHLPRPVTAATGEGWVSLSAVRTPVTIAVAPVTPTTAGVTTDVDVTVTEPDGTPATGDVVAVVGTTTTTATLVDGQARLKVSAGTVGTHPITVTWRPGTVDAWSTTTSFVVERSGVVITADAPIGVLPGTLDLAVTVTSTTPGRTPTGDVVVFDRTTGIVIGEDTLVDGEATVSIDTIDLLPGTRDVTVTYGSDDEHTFGSTISTLTLQGATTLVTRPSTSVAFGATHDIPGSVIRTLVESPAATGTVTATIPGHDPVTATVVDGEYTLTTPADLAPGSYDLTLDYSGDDLWAGSTATSTLTVGQGSVTLTLTGPSTVPVGTPSTWTATVERVADDTPTGPVVVSRLASFASPFAAATADTVTPTGTVELLVDGEVVDSADLADGTVDLVAPAATTTGTRAVSARYLGSDGYVALDQSALTTDLTITPVSTDGGETGGGETGGGNGGTGTTPDKVTTQPSASPTATAERGLASTGTSGILPALGISLLLAGAALLTARTIRLRRD